VGQESGHLSERNYDAKADRSHEDVFEQKTNGSRLGLSRGRRRKHEHRLDQRTKGVRRARNARERYQEEEGRWISIVLVSEEERKRGRRETHVPETD
jgi:hypothetical protein